MFDNVYQQNWADRLKGMILQLSHPDDRTDAQAVINLFERTPWYPQVMEKVVKADGRLTLDGGDIVIDGHPREVIPAILLTYIEEVQNGLPDHIYGTDEAMTYIAAALTRGGHPVSIWGVKKMINTGRLQGQLVGKTLAFTRQQLDTFVTDYLADPPKRGPKGPHKQKEGSF